MRFDELDQLIAAVPSAQGILTVDTERGARTYALGPRTQLDAEVPLLDWRTAPLAGAFFRHGPGELYELEAGSRINEGRVSARWVITGTRYVVESEAGRDEGELRIDAAASPASVDLVGTSGPHGNKTIRAIFRLRGDLLQLCYDVSGEDRRPVTFVTGKGSMQLMVRYRRES